MGKVDESFCWAVMIVGVGVIEAMRVAVEAGNRYSKVGKGSRVGVTVGFAEIVPVIVRDGVIVWVKSVETIAVRVGVGLLVKVEVIARVGVEVLTGPLRV